MKTIIVGHVDNGKTTTTAVMESVLEKHRGIVLVDKKEVDEPVYYKPSPIDAMPNLIMYEKSKSKFHK